MSLVNNKNFIAELLQKRGVPHTYLNTATQQVVHSQSLTTVTQQVVHSQSLTTVTQVVHSQSLTTVTQQVVHSQSLTTVTQRERVYFPSTPNKILF